MKRIEPKAEKRWVVLGSKGNYLNHTLKDTEEEAIAAFTLYCNWDWESGQKLGYRAVQVLVTPIAKKRRAKIGKGGK